MNLFNTIAEKIIEEQEGIIGPVALEQAQKVPGLKVDWQKHEVSIIGNESDVIQKLVEQYRNIFGQASVEACKEAVSGVISKVPKDQVPNLLR
jgi:hypothetical protein